MSCETLEQLLIGKRAVFLAAIAQDEVVENVDGEGLSSQHQESGEQPILLAGRGRA
jgi:hypothetical protein